MKRSQNEEKSDSKRRKTEDEVALHDDLVYEVGKWLPSSFLLSSCVLVSKQWKTVIEKRLDLEFELDELHTIRLMSKKEVVVERITRLSLTMGRQMREFYLGRYFCEKYFDEEPFDEYGTMHFFGEITTDRYGHPLSDREPPIKLLQSMKHLKHLSLYGFLLSKDSIEQILTTIKLDSFAIKSCSLQWTDLEPFTSSECQLSLDLGYSGEYMDIGRWGNYMNGSIEEAIDVAQSIPQFKSLYLSIHSPYYQILECLADRLCKLSISLSVLIDRYLPLMTNLTELELRSNGNNRIDLNRIDLSRLVNLKSLFSGYGIVDRHTGKVYPKPDPLDTLIGQLVRLRIDPNDLSNQDWPDAHRLCKLEELQLYTDMSPSFKFPYENLSKLTLESCKLHRDTVHGMRLLRKLTHLFANDTLVLESAGEDTRDLTFADLCYEDGEDAPRCDLTRLRELVIALPPKTSRALSVLPLMEDLHRLCLWSREIVDMPDEHMEQIASATSVTDLQLTSCIGMRPVKLCSGGVRISENGGEYLLSMGRVKRLCIASPFFSNSLLDVISLMHKLERLDLCTATAYDAESYYRRRYNAEKRYDTYKASIDAGGLEKLARMKNLSLLHVDISALKESCVDVLLGMSHLEYLYITCRKEDYSSIEADLLKSSIANHIGICCISDQ